MNLEFWNNKKIRYGIIAAVLVIIAVITFWIRMLPSGILAGTGDMNAGPDAWYNLRLLEVALANTFGYISFEPFTLYPTGQDIVWGPLFTWISAIFAMIAGAASRVDLISVVSVVPPVLAVCMVPVMYFLGKKCGDWKTGLLAALFIAVICGEYLVRSVYGYFDHHIAETLFSTLFCLCYVWGIAALKNREVSLKSAATLKFPLIYGAIAGIAYFLGLLTMTTIVVFGLMAAVFTAVVFIINQVNNKPTEYLLVFNAVTFIVSIVCLLIYGIRDFTFSMYTYSIGLILANFLIVLGTVVLYLLSLVFKKLEKPWYFYLGSLVVLGIAGILIVMFALPDIFNQTTASLSNFFVISNQSATILEMQSWNPQMAWSSFNFGLILSLGGIGWLIYEVIKGKREEALFILVWSLLMTMATVSHVRWEYYIAANIALLSAVCVAETINFAKKDVLLLAGRKSAEPEKAQNKRKAAKKTKVSSVKKSAGILKTGLLLIVLVFSVLFVGISAGTAVSTSENLGSSVTPSYWMEACEWLNENTPETGLDYLKLYDKDGFSYPAESYGVLSWWDYGHYITAIGERMPVSNPFQSGVSGTYGVAQILLEQDESVVAKKLDRLDTKYVMTDTLMSNTNFPPITVWADNEKQIAPYYYMFYQQAANGMLEGKHAYSPGYYNTLVVRLQNYDGSMIDAGPCTVIYASATGDYAYPVIINGEVFTKGNDAWKKADAFNADEANTSAGMHAYVVSNNVVDSTGTYYHPSVKIPALTHFRMVYETDKSYVKTFEYVKGAVIKGDGTIQATITTNTGRQFTYTQESSNGTFVVPYATGKNGAVTASAYTLSNGKTVTVSEDAVQNGLQVN
ncbi:MAG TPA: oligosaccharyl transferase, archaeosortase A system-associated [Methanocorpusculum sp.]|nr:oligosaccharyl transferase, archaeosortase A system-associated [Methanocorpusculum sp.]